ncbi:hypothetical protein Plhal710r2_c042g0143001 [Plasmopara halstedii]
MRLHLLLMHAILIAASLLMTVIAHSDSEKTLKNTAFRGTMTTEFANDETHADRVLTTPVLDTNDENRWWFHNDDNNEESSKHRWWFHNDDKDEESSKTGSEKKSEKTSEKTSENNSHPENSNKNDDKNPHSNTNDKTNDQSKPLNKSGVTFDQVSKTLIMAAAVLI